MHKTLKFLKQLAQNNNIEWFNAHKNDYLEIKKKIDDLTQELINRVALFDSEAALLTPEKCTYRIYRDIRFSSDKAPYKSHIGIFINPPFGKKVNRMGYYLHIEPGNSCVAAGTVCLPSKTVTAIRHAIRDNIDEYIQILNEPEFKDTYTEIGLNPVKTYPKGFQKDWPWLDLVRPRDFCAFRNLTDKEICDEELPARVGQMFRIAKPFNDFINFTIDEMAEQ